MPYLKGHYSQTEGNWLAWNSYPARCVGLLISIICLKGLWLEPRETFLILKSLRRWAAIDFTIMGAALSLYKHILVIFLLSCFCQIWLEVKQKCADFFSSFVLHHVFISSRLHWLDLSFCYFGMMKRRLTSDLSTVYGCVLSRCCEDHHGDKLDKPFHGDEGLWHPCMRTLSISSYIQNIHAMICRSNITL